MNKRGQMYILAVIVLSIAIFSVMKVTNKFVAPTDDNFDFFVENFEGERSYVMNLGILEEKEEGEVYYLKGTPYEPGLLEVFQDFGINTGLVLIEYDEGWTVSNFLGEDIDTNCEDCSVFTLPSADLDVAEISFSMFQGGKRWKPAGEWELVDDYYTYNFEESKESITIIINENDYIFNRPLGGEKRVESLIFRNIAKDYVRVVNI